MYYNCMQESELSEVIPYPSPSTRYYSYFTPFACHGSEVGIVSRTWCCVIVELYLEVENAEIESTGRWIGESKSPSSYSSLSSLSRAS